MIFFKPKVYIVKIHTLTEGDKIFEKLLNIEHSFNEYYGISFLKPKNHNKYLELTSRLREIKYFDSEQYWVISRMARVWGNNYFKVKELIKQEPRIHAQRFIGKSKIRKFLFERDKVCLRCGTDKNLSIDHIVPIYYGGENKISNLQVLCKSCNSWKSTQTIDFR